MTDLSFLVVAPTVPEPPVDFNRCGTCGKNYGRGANDRCTCYDSP